MTPFVNGKLYKTQVACGKPFSLLGTITGGSVCVRISGPTAGTDAAGPMAWSMEAKLGIHVA